VNHAFSISSARANILFGPWAELSMPLAIDTYLIDHTVITWKSISVLEIIDIFIAQFSSKKEPREVWLQ